MGEMRRPNRRRRRPVAAALAAAVVQGSSSAFSAQPTPAPSSISNRSVPVPGYECLEALGDAQRCYVGIDFTGVVPHEHCWKHCSETYPDRFDLVVAYALREDDTCCCKRSCSCLAPSETSVLAIAESADPLYCGDNQTVNETLPYELVAAARCRMNSTTSKCLFDESIVSPEDCYEACGRNETGFFSLNTTSCCCHSDCGCVEPDRESWLGRPLGALVADCPDTSGTLPPELDFTTYRGASCSPLSTAAPSALPPFDDVNNSNHTYYYMPGSNETDDGFYSEKNYDSEYNYESQDNSTLVPVDPVYQDLDPYASCVLTCNANDSYVAATSNGTACWCSTVCDCLCAETPDAVVSLFTTETPLSCDVETPDNGETYEFNFDTFAGVSCESGSDLLCFYDFEYDPRGSDWEWLWRWECWNWCQEVGLYTVDSLAASYGNPAEKECCCVAECGCFDAADDAYLLSLNKSAPVPSYCPSPDTGSKKKKSTVGRDDIWWIVLIVIGGTVFLAFFVAVEEIDRERRQKAAAHTRSGYVRPPNKAPAQRNSSDKDDSKEERERS